MRFIITILFFIPHLASATNYYVDSSKSDSNDGLSPSTAFKTIGKFINVATKGDTVFLHKGDSWNESFTIPVDSLYFGSYGSGNNPLITGFQSVTGWTNTGNIWTADFLNSAASQNTVYINGALRAKGRFPNNSYLTFSSHSGSTQITGSLTGDTNYTRGEVVIRPLEWVIDRGTITSQSTGTINFSPAATYAPHDGNGYFIQNHPATLDTLNEWCDTTTIGTHKIFIYATTTPTVKASSIDVLVFITSRKNISFKGIDFEGANSNAIQIFNSTNVSFDSCHVHDCFSGVYDNGDTSFSFINSKVDHIWNNGITQFNDLSSNVSNNTITDIATAAGMGAGGNQAYGGIIGYGKRLQINDNTIQRIGYIGIWLRSDSSYIRRNNTDSCLLVKMDGGGIYSVGESGKYHDGNFICSNIVTHSVGSSAGIGSPSGYVFGIYQDDFTYGTVIDSNTLAYNYYSGLMLHDGDSFTVRHNIIAFNGSISSTSQIMYVMLSGGMQNVTNNTLYSQSTQYVLNLASVGIIPSNFGIMDSNYYSKPSNENQIVKYGSTYLSLAQWQDSLMDIHSGGTPTGITSAQPLLFINTSKHPITYGLNGSYKTLDNTEYSYGVEVRPYQSILLFKETSDQPRTKYPLQIKYNSVTR